MKALLRKVFRRQPAEWPPIPVPASLIESLDLRRPGDPWGAPPVSRTWADVKDEAMARVLAETADAERQYASRSNDPTAIWGTRTPGAVPPPILSGPLPPGGLPYVDDETGGWAVSSPPPAHDPVRAVSGRVSCSCGWETGHYALASDAWLAYEAHVAASSE